MLLLFARMALAEPSGAEVTGMTSERREDPAAWTLSAQAGNVTGINFNQTRPTDIWQGYYGNITGIITLDDASNRTMYDWNIAKVTGEVYATRTIVPDWEDPGCASQDFIDAEETSLGISPLWTDSINNTFTSTSHEPFILGIDVISGCRSMQAYNSTGEGSFWNALLNVSDIMVYVSIINNDVNSFDNSTTDFEMLVPTDHATQMATYYFYAELD